MKVINQIEPNITEVDRIKVSKYLASGGWCTEHKQTKKFEEIFKKITNTKYAICMPNGTLTLLAILLTLKLKKSDVVLVPSYTMVATANAVKLAGGRVEFVDISEKNLCMCPQDLKKKLKKFKTTRAIIYVTLNGRSGHIEKIKKTCSFNKVKLIEDSAHSLGSYYNKKHHGTFGYASSFSFSMPKIITTGQGGMICTNNKKLNTEILYLKNFGRKSDGSDDYKNIGYNFKFTDLQAVLGQSQILDLKKKIKKKKFIVDLYTKHLSKNKNLIIKKFDKNETPWFMDIYVKKNRQKLINYLKLKKIKIRKVYPSLHNLNFYKKKYQLLNAELYCKIGLWLPSSLNLQNKQIKYICDKINEFKYD